jgi:hypothetical protein
VSATIRSIVHIARLLVLFDFNQVRDGVELRTGRVIGRIAALLCALDAAAFDVAELALLSQCQCCHYHTMTRVIPVPFVRVAGDQF